MCSNSELDVYGEDMIPLSFTVKPDGQAQIVPNQSVKASYATELLQSTPDSKDQEYLHGHRSTQN